jgi:hypothetical protein
VVVERETRLLEPLADDLRRWRQRCLPSEDGFVSRLKGRALERG